MTERTATRPPLWRDIRALAWVFQLAVVVVVVAVLSWLWGNLQTNSEATNIPLSFDFLDQPAGFPIPGSDFNQQQPVKDAIFEGLLNTIRLASAGIVLATVLGVLLGVARLSANYFIRSGSRLYVEFVRNVPLLSLLYLIYLAIVLDVFPPPTERVDGEAVISSWQLDSVAIINTRGINVAWFDGSAALLFAIVAVACGAGWLVARWRRTVSERTGSPARSATFAAVAAAVLVIAGWLAFGFEVTTPEQEGNQVTGGIELTPAYFGALVALVLYTSSHIAEIIRGSIQAVPKGQGEAAQALALSGAQRLRFVVLPQAMRIAIPPMGNQYLNLLKNSSLAAVFSYPELTKIAQLTQSNRSPVVPVYTVTMLLYLGLSLIIALFVNLANRHLKIVER